jgi:hypothetical protein
VWPRVERWVVTLRGVWPSHPVSQSVTQPGALHSADGLNHCTHRASKGFLGVSSHPCTPMCSHNLWWVPSLHTPRLCRWRPLTRDFCNFAPAAGRAGAGGREEPAEPVPVWEVTGAQGGSRGLKRVMTPSENAIVVSTAPGTGRAPAVVSSPVHCWGDSVCTDE